MADQQQGNQSQKQGTPGQDHMGRKPTDPSYDGTTDPSSPEYDATKAASTQRQDPQRR